MPRARRNFVSTMFSRFRLVFSSRSLKGIRFYYMHNQGAQPASQYYTKCCRFPPTAYFETYVYIFTYYRRHFGESWISSLFRIHDNFLPFWLIPFPGIPFWFICVFLFEDCIYFTIFTMKCHSHECDLYTMFARQWWRWRQAVVTGEGN